MTVPQSPVLEFPAMLHGQPGAIRRSVRSTSEGWVQEYFKTGTFTQPRSLLQVPPGEVLLMHSAAELEFMDRPSWRIHMFVSAFSCLHENISDEEYPRARDTFESFCLNTPWGALYHAVCPPPLRSADRMASRFAALLRFWDVLQGPRYVYGVAMNDPQLTLDQLMDSIYRQTLEAWCPGGPASVRELLALTVERMSHATREECMDAVLRVMSGLLQTNTDLRLKHREVLGGSRFQREHLASLSSKDFEEFSSADLYSVTGQLYAWSRQLDRPRSAG